MTKLIKDAITSYIPGNPGVPGSPYVAPQPARTVYEEQTVCTGGGYETQIVLGADGQYYFFQASTPPVCTTEGALVYYPATSEVAAVPYSPPTAAQIAVSLNQGWNSYARTVDQLLPGTYIEHVVKYGSYGALLAVGKPGMEGVPIAAFPYGVMVDTSGIYSFESGAAVALTDHVPDIPIRIARLTDGRIVYSIGGAVVSISASGVYDQYDELYVYGLLYSAYDEVTISEFKTGNLIAEPSARLTGSGEITALPLPRVSLDGSSEFAVSVATAVMFSGYGTLTAEFSHTLAYIDATLTGGSNLAATLDGGGRASFSLEPMQFLASDADSEHIGFGYTELPLFTFSSAGDAFVPAQPTVGYFNLPFYTMWAEGSETEIGNASFDLPLHQFIASEGEYGIGDFSLPLHRFNASGGFIADDAMLLMSAGVARSQHANAIDLVMVINSRGELSSSLTMTREQALELMSALQQSDSFSMLGVYGYSMLSSANAVSLQNAGIGGLPDLDDSSAVWVVNIDTKASSQYDRYSFNSFITRNGVCYGVAPDGIYRLDGATDAGVPVDALAYLGRMDFATALQKLLPNAYLGASSTGKLKLEVDADGSIYVYETRNSEDGTFRSHRVDLGRGLKANMLGLTVKNKDGADFKLATVDLLQAPGGRRI